ncbi:MAG: DUF4159 domain-containing protein [Verrucomicrobia bacterium]|nr:DUF4159 domain-containing protein [Verrucomicrobiota bacterium]
MKRILIWVGLGCVLIAATVSMAQRGRGGYGEHWFPGIEGVKTAREAPQPRGETPIWTNAPTFDRDVFSFARLRYSRLSDSSVWWRGGHWYSDFPYSDLNLSFRLQQLTAIKVNPHGRVLDIGDPELFDYPWVYMVEPALLVFEEEEVPILRKYLLNGGFLMADDFWSEPQWANFEREMKRVFPERTFTELPMDHPLFKSVFPLEGPKNKLQVPNVETGRDAERTGITWETKTTRMGTEECTEVHIRALFDDKNRLMVLACHNTDYGDGWEREREDDYFFHRFSEKIAYPLAINIIFYVMTH